jgi:hypothetical protein
MHAVFCVAGRHKLCLSFQALVQTSETESSCTKHVGHLQISLVCHGEHRDITSADHDIRAEGREGTTLSFQSHVHMLSRLSRSNYPEYGMAS